MSMYRLANVLLEDTRYFHEAPTLYVRTNTFLSPAKSAGAWRIEAGTTDFTTFFNALSVSKWRTYTVADEFSLHLELRGAACSYVQTHADKISLEAAELASTRREIPASKGWVALDIPLEVANADILVGFVLTTSGPVEIRSSYYQAEVAQGDIRPQELAIATTTFRKEDYVQRNIELVRSQILASSQRVASHLTMHVMDNGRTLDAEALSGGGIFVHPNDNVGGAGGFARGMIEAMEQEVPATHVLLMDDDVEVSPESIIRTYNLLSIVRDEWADAFVAGGMMSWDRPDLLWEDGGYMAADGTCDFIKGHRGDFIGPRDFARMSAFQGIVANESYKPNVRSHPDFLQRYAAWWYCCIPTTTIAREGLPLPLFVRYDDVEYGLRCKPKFMTMNGICIWHMDFSLRYNAAVEHYQTTRNSFIIQATTGVAKLSNFEGQLRERLMHELTKFNYTDAELILDGFEDFLKGPGFFAAKGKAEETYLAANRRREQLIPYDELREKALAEIGVDIADYDNTDLRDNYPLGLTMHERPFRVSRMQTFEKSINGQLFGRLKQYAGTYAVIKADATWPFGTIYGVDTIVAIDAPSRRGTIRHRDNKRCRQIWKRLLDDLHEYHANKKEIEAMYRQARTLLTSLDFWKDYLSMNEEETHA